MNGGSEITIDMSTCLNNSLLGSIRIDLHNHAVFEIQDSFHAHAGCPDKKNHAPCYLFICTFLYICI